MCASFPDKIALLGFNHEGRDSTRMPRACRLGFSLSGHNYSMACFILSQTMTNQSGSDTMTGKKELVAVEHRLVHTLGR
jgi:hypothetical protein